MKCSFWLSVIILLLQLFTCQGVPVLSAYNATSATVYESDYVTPYTMINECRILNDAKASDGVGTSLKSLRKITKYFVLDGRWIWVTE